MTTALTALRMTATLVLLAAAWPPIAVAAQARRETYDVAYEVRLRPELKLAQVRVLLAGDALPSRLTFSIDPARHRAFDGNGRLEVAARSVTWYPPPMAGWLGFDFELNHQLDSGSFDSYVTENWAVFRGDRMIPPVRVRARPSLVAQTSLRFQLPEDWSVLTAHPEPGPNRFAIDQPARRFERPAGWMLAGRIGSRHETIAGIDTVVGAPTGDAAKRQDTLAFLSWNLPHVKALFPDFTDRLLVIRAGDPLFRGGLSGPASLFLHTDRPLISENRSSPVLHEVIHVALGINGGAASDWIVEGLAEFYSIEVLRRSGGISERRFRDAMALQERRAAGASTLFVAAATGAVTAKAVTVFQALDQELRAATGGRASLDDVARELAARRGEVSLELLQSLAATIAGRPVLALDRSRLAPGH